MAFIAANLKKTTPSQLQDIQERYTYQSTDSFDDILSEGYFLGAFDCSACFVVVDITAGVGWLTIVVDSDTGTASNQSGMPAAADVAASIDNQGVYPVSRSGDGVSTALAAARAAGKALVLSHGVYEISSTITLLSNDKIIIKPTAVLRAVAGFSGNAMITIGDTADTEFTENVLIDGGGLIDGDGLVSRGIFVASGRFSKIRNLQINGITGKPLYIGNNSSVQTCYEVDIFNVNMLHKDAQNSSTSIGLLFENTTDCYASEMVIIGYRKGVEVTSTAASIEISKIHPWAREVHGAMERCFNILGSATASQCNADSPFNLITGVGDLYGWYISGNLMGDMLRVFMNLTTNHESDDRLWPFYFNGNTESVISTAKVHGGSATYRFKGFAGGDTVNNVIANKITGPSANYVIAP